MTEQTLAVPLLTAEQVAERLSVEPSWVYRAAREKKLPSVKVGRYVRFRGHEVQAFIDQGGVPEPNEASHSQHPGRES